MDLVFLGPVMLTLVYWLIDLVSLGPVLLTQTVLECAYYGLALGILHHIRQN